MRRIGTFLLGGIALAAASAAEARVTKIVIDSRAPAFNSRSFGTVGSYETLRGRAFGEVDPKDRHNAIIQDINLAPKNAKGNVEYITTFTLLMPADLSKASGVLFYEIANRGNSMFNSFDIGGNPANATSDPLFYKRGYVVLTSGWQGDLLPGPTATRSVAGSRLETITVPRAKNPDGSSFTGPFMARLPLYGGDGPSGDMVKVDIGRAGELAYSPASFDTHQSTLSGALAENIRGQQVGTRKQIASTDWAWVNCQSKAPADATTSPGNLCAKLTKGTFDPKLVYTLVFPAKDPLVLGLGFAAMRDVVAFFRHADRDESGTANPIAGKVPFVVAQGISQSGNYAKSYVHLGFNEDEQGRMVWDSLNSHIASRFVPLNFRFAIPGGSPTMFAPGNEGALWWTATSDAKRGRPTTSLLARCSATKTCPKIFETFGGAEFWNQRMSLGLVSNDDGRDIPLPDNVRRYYFPGTMHAGGAGGFNLTTKKGQGGVCVLMENPNSEVESMRALLVAMTDWTVKDIAPPESRYPTLASGLLTTDKKGGPFKFPAIPGVPEPYGISNPVLDYDFGPHLNANDLSGYITQQPPVVKQALQSYIPAVDADGNDRGGVPSILHQAPLGTYMGWNITDTGVLAGQICSLNGSFVPFAKTKAEREKAEDPRPSIEERYGDRQGYICAVSKAAQQSVKDRFLLAEDAKYLIGQATASTATGDLAFLPTAATARGKALCAAANATD